MSDTKKNDPAEPIDPDDLGLGAVDDAFEALHVDRAWSLAEARGFTWWPHRIRQRVWSEPAIAVGGGRGWQVRTHLPLFREVEDAPEVYRFLSDSNAVVPVTGMVFDAADGTISARAGALIEEGAAPFTRAAFAMAAAVGVGSAWHRTQEVPDGFELDDLPHPGEGWRADPARVLNLVADAESERAGPVLPAPTIRRVLKQVERDGLVVRGYREGTGFELEITGPDGTPCIVAIGNHRHPFLGDVLLARLTVPGTWGVLRGPWLANALGLAEAGDWSGEDRPQPLGAWVADDSDLLHLTFLPARLFGDLPERTADVVLGFFLDQADRRVRFAVERLRWLGTAAADRYPDEPSPAETVDAAADGDGDGEAAAEEPTPVAERSFGPAARERRPRASLPVGGPAREPAELVVDPADPAAYAEIDDAVAAAEDGDRIRVRPGRYRRPVVLDRAVIVEGDGPVESIVLEPAGGECLGAAASGAVVRGLTIRPARPGNDGEAWSAIAVHDVALTAEDCRLSSHLGATVWVAGPASALLLRDCTIEDGTQNGVYVVEEGRAALVGCRIVGHRWPMVAGGMHASLRLERCEIVDNLDDGVAALAGARLIVEQSTIAGNAGSGVLFVESAPSSTVADCRITGNGGAGIMVQRSRGALILRNRIDDNDAGVVIEGGARPLVEANELGENVRVGIGVAGDGSDPRVVDNTVAARGSVGIAVRMGATGTFEGNRVEAGSASGIWVTDEDTAPTLRRNVVTGGGAVAVRVNDGGGGRFESNDLRGNAGGSWQIEAPGELHRSGNLEDTGRTPGGSGPGGSAGSGGSEGSGDPGTDHGGSGRSGGSRGPRRPGGHDARGSAADGAPASAAAPGPRPARGAGDPRLN